MTKIGLEEINYNYYFNFDLNEKNNVEQLTRYFALPDNGLTGNNNLLHYYAKNLDKDRMEFIYNNFPEVYQSLIQKRNNKGYTPIAVAVERSLKRNNKSSLSFLASTNLTMSDKGLVNSALKQLEEIDQGARVGLDTERSSSELSNVQEQRAREFYYLKGGLKEEISGFKYHKRANAGRLGDRKQKVKDIVNQAYANNKISKEDLDYLKTQYEDTNNLPYLNGKNAFRNFMSRLILTNLIEHKKKEVGENQYGDLPDYETDIYGDMATDLGFDPNHPVELLNFINGVKNNIPHFKPELGITNILHFYLLENYQDKTKPLDYDRALIVAKNFPELLFEYDIQGNQVIDLIPENLKNDFLSSPLSVIKLELNDDNSLELENYQYSPSKNFGFLGERKEAVNNLIAKLLIRRDTQCEGKFSYVTYEELIKLLELYKNTSNTRGFYGNKRLAKYVSGLIENKEAHMSLVDLLDIEVVEESTQLSEYYSSSELPPPVQVAQPTDSHTISPVQSDHSSISSEGRVKPAGIKAPNAGEGPFGGVQTPFKQAEELGSNPESEESQNTSSAQLSEQSFRNQVVVNPLYTGVEIVSGEEDMLSIFDHEKQDELIDELLRYIETQDILINKNATGEMGMLVGVRALQELIGEIKSKYELTDTLFKSYLAEVKEMHGLNISSDNQVGSTDFGDLPGGRKAVDQPTEPAGEQGFVLRGQDITGARDLQQEQFDLNAFNAAIAALSSSELSAESYKSR